MARDPLLELLLGPEPDIGLSPALQTPDEERRRAFFAPQIQEPLPEVPRRSPDPGGNPLLDTLARSLQDVHSPGGYGRAGDVFGANVASGFARGFSGGRMGQIEQRQGVESALREDARLRNARNAAATVAARQEKQATLQRQDVKAEKVAAKSHRLPAWVAKGLGDSSLVQLPVTAAEYLDYSKAAREANKPATPKDERLVAIKDPATGNAIYVPESQARGQQVATGGDRPRPPAATEREHLAIDKAMLDLVNNVRETYNAKLVGPRRGLVGGLTNATGMFTTQGQSIFRAYVAGLRNQLLKARSGGAVTEGEAARLLEEIPTVKQPAKTFMDQLEAFENNYRNIAQARRDVMTGTSVDLSRIPPLPRPALSTFDHPGGP